jgi:putative heme-binding domain-containing protein
VVLRLQGADLATDADTKAMVEKALDANRGTAVFVEIVEAFGIQDRDADLLQIAIRYPDESCGAQALRMVLAHQGTAPIGKLLVSADAIAVARALGNANDARAMFLLSPIVTDGAQSLALRQEAVRALGKFEAGAKTLLALRKKQSIPAELDSAVQGALALAPWESVRAALPQTQSAPATLDGPLPPLPELAKRTGDAARGGALFAALCSNCHQVAGKGIEYGPNLSEIGSKLGKDGLYLAILYPDAGIEFQFETTLLQLKDGNTAIGILVSETEQELALKRIGGTVVKYRTAEVLSREKQKRSSMPTGLQATLREQALVDLVEYLAGLRKA